MSLVTHPLLKILEPSRMRRRLKIGSVYAQLTAGFLIFALAFGAVAWRLERTPDIFTDEILYSRLAIRVAGEGALVWDTGRPVVIHPPLFFLVQGVYRSLVPGPPAPLYAPGDIFATVYHARSLNAVLAGLTATLLFWLGRHLRGLWLGVLLVLLFVIDPFGIRINRRAMIETLAVLLSLSGMALLLAGYRDGRLSRPRAIGAGLLMGAGLLTKDLAFTTPLAVMVFAVWEMRRRGAGLRCIGAPTLLAPFLAGGIALLSYALVLLWALAIGHWERFAAVKVLSIQRLLGLVHTSGWNRPDVSLIDFLTQRLVDYGTSYLILALGGVATVVLLVFGREKPAGRLLAAWGLVLYPVFAAVALFGSGNDQFFYFLLLPAMILFGYGLTLFLEQAETRWQKPVNWSLAKRGVVIAVVLVVLPFNIVLWWYTYGVGVDDGYRQLSSYVDSSVPSGIPINASGDDLKFRYFFPDHPIARASTPQEARDEGVQYFVLSPKDVWAHYGRVTPELADWIVTRGERRFSTVGNSYGEIYLYSVDSGAEQTTSGVPVTENASFARSYAPAETGFIGVFLLSSGVWYGGWIALALWLYLDQRKGRGLEIGVRTGEPQ
jgi:4-amino-4-deoxy-L-arabinose transferase-like glycosyltransferase